MSVWYRQSVDGERGDPFVIEPVDPDDIDADLLRRKATSATANGWDVEWTGDRSFTATKDRWGGSLCVREFWAD